MDRFFVLIEEATLENVKSGEWFYDDVEGLTRDRNCIHRRKCWTVRETNLLNSDKNVQVCDASKAQSTGEPLAKNKIAEAIECYVLCDEPQKEVAKTDTHFYLNSLSGETFALVKKTTQSPSPSPKDDWISVEERLPEVNQWCICVNRYGGTMLLACQFDGEGFVPYGNPYKDERVSHWQPLPAPPETNIISPK